MDARGRLLAEDGAPHLFDDLLAGLLFIGLGISFIALQGTNALAGIYEGWGFTELSFQADEWVKDATSPVPDTLVFALAALLAAGAGLYAYMRFRRSDDDELAEEEAGGVMALPRRDQGIDK